MQRLRNFILVIGLLVVAFLNLRESLNHFHKGVQHPVGENAVSVYTASSNSNAAIVPVQEFTANKFSETGQVVSVYLKYAYEDREIPLTRSVLLTIAATFLVYFSTFFVSWLLPKRA